MPEWSSGFPYFFQFKSEFSNEEFMTWAIVHSWSFCWLYRASPSLAANCIISLILVLTVWWCSCVETSLVLLKEGVCSDHHILLANLLAFLLLHIVLQGQTCLLLQVTVDFLFLHSSPIWWKGYLVLVLAIEGLVDHYRTIQLQLFQHYWLGNRLGLLWYWMVCFGNEKGSFCHFWDCTECCILSP